MNKKKLCMLIPLLFVFCACSKPSSDNPSTSVIISGDSSYEITTAGEYTFTGNYKGSILVNAGEEDEIKIILSGATIENDAQSPIYCLSAGNLKINLAEGTTNKIIDNRKPKQETDEDQGQGAIYSKCDTKITGSGSLEIIASYNNGIHTTKDLTLQSKVKNNSTIKVTAINNALKGKDSVTISSGDITLISTGGDGIETEDSNVSSKGNQRGTVTINGGKVDIYSCCDGIDASYDAVIEKNEDDSEPIINIYTSNYSEYSTEKVTTSESKMYLRFTSNNTSYRYAVLFKDANENQAWANATYASSSRSGRTTYYYYSVNRPSTATGYRVFCFNSSVTENTESGSRASMAEFQNINTNYDTVNLTMNNSSITASGWSAYSSSQGGGWGGSQGNTDKAEYSAKGIKAHNKVTISAGETYIKAYDDCVHAENGATLENGSTGLGDLTINGGKLTLFAADDALHADRYLYINGGEIDIQSSYEGVEANVINVTGGTTKVYATDDGLNAANKVNMTPNINISGGILDITVYGNDVDGIDSNGSISITGGFIVTKGGTGRMSTGLDCDGTFSMTGGSLVCFGAPEKAPTISNGVSSKTISGSYAIGTYLVTNGTETITVTTKYSYTIIYVYSKVNVNFTITKQ